MDKESLQKAYEAIRMLKALDLPISREQMNSICELEEAYLKEEIAPFIMREVEPLVKEMMGDFLLEVSYSKDNGLNVQCLNSILNEASENNRRRRKITKVIEENEAPLSKEIPARVLNAEKKQASTLRVYREDNTIIEEASSALTLCETIKEIGPEKVYNLFIPLDGMYLVSKVKNTNARSDMHYVGDGYYVNTHSNNKTKKRHLERIFHELDLRWKVEII